MFWLDLYREVWSEYFDKAYPCDKHDFTPCNFPPIFTGTQPSLYYAALWSEVRAATPLFFFLCDTCFKWRTICHIQMIACDIVAQLREQNGGIITPDIKDAEQIRDAFLHMQSSSGSFKKAFRLYTFARDPKYLNFDRFISKCILPAAAATHQSHPCKTYT